MIHCICLKASQTFHNLFKIRGSSPKFHHYARIIYWTCHFHSSNDQNQNVICKTGSKSLCSLIDQIVISSSTIKLMTLWSYSMYALAYCQFWHIMKLRSNLQKLLHNIDSGLRINCRRIFKYAYSSCTYTQ